MKYKNFGGEVVVVLETGDNIHKSIETVCHIEGIGMGSITGFGGVNYLKLGIWNNDIDEYDYLVKEKGNMELSNLTGNITIKDNLPSVHIHITAADNNFMTFGGHLVDGVVQNSMELYIYPGANIINKVKRDHWYFMDI